ncbi:MAG: hypothetical protein AB8H03_24185 [Saprospiraceae bacterium]
MRRTIAINILVLAAMLIVINILSHFILQIYYWNREKTAATLPAMTNENYSQIRKEFNQLETEYQPFIAWKRKPVKKEFTNIDVNGNRLTKNSNSKSKKVIRFFGGSTMWGAGVEDANTIPSRFGKCTDEYSIVNHGGTGFNSRQSLALFTNLMVKDDSTNMVVFYDGVNDVADLCIKKMSIPGHGREVQMRNELTTINSTGSYFRGKDGIFNLSKQLLSKVFIQNTALLIQGVVGRYFKKSLPDPYCCQTELERAIQVANHLLNTWKVAHQIAEANGIQFIAILQPNLFVGNVENDYLNLERRGSLGKNFEAVYPILKKKIETYDWIYDFTEIFDDKKEPLYFDFCHVNKQGNEIIAKQICEILDDLNSK